MKTRRCSTCKAEKPLSDYPGVRNYYCRDCRTAYRRRWKESNRERERLIKERWIAANPERSKATYQSWQERNRDRVRRVKTTYREENRGRVRAWNRFGRYGITETVFREMLADQDHRCAICLGDIDADNSHIDHCHATGMIRCILCPGCNQGLGNFRENEDALLAAAAYLQAFREP